MYFLGVDCRTYVYRQRSSVVSGGNHGGCGPVDCGWHRDYNKNHLIQQTSRQNKDEYDEITPEDQNSNGTEGNSRKEHLAAQGKYG